MNCNTLQHRSIQCSTLLDPNPRTPFTATHKLQHTATHCNTLQHTEEFSAQHSWIKTQERHSCYECFQSGAGRWRAGVLAFLLCCPQSYHGACVCVCVYVCVVCGLGVSSSFFAALIPITVLVCVCVCKSYVCVCVCVSVSSVCVNVCVCVCVWVLSHLPFLLPDVRVCLCVYVCAYLCVCVYISRVYLRVCVCM